MSPDDAHLASVATTVAVWMGVPIAVAATTPRAIRVVSSVVSVAVILRIPSAASSIIHSTLAATISGGVGVVGCAILEGGAARRVFRVLLTLTLLFAIPCHVGPAQAAPYYTRGAETLVMCLLQAGDERALTELWSTWAVSPALLGTDRPYPLSKRRALGLLGGATLGAALLLVGFEVAARFDNMPWLLPLLGIAFQIPGIGLLRVVGLRLAGLDPGHGFRLPVSRPSLSTVWRSWNVWFGQAFQALVFEPFARRFVLAQRSNARGVLQDLAIVLTFVCVGLHHDVCRSLVETLSDTRGFLHLRLETVVLFLWLGACTALDTRVARHVGSRSLGFFRSLVLMGTLYGTGGLLHLW